jgi:nitrogen fixation/metabolism regulation signal transduction histidine kinase
MPSLPMPESWTEQNSPAPGSILAKLDIGNLVTAGGVEGNDEQFLLRAFRSFAQAAASLEQSYGTLRAEVEHLRRELATSNSNLARSFEENRNMRVHLDRILAGLPCGVLVATGDDRITMANPEALRLLLTDKSTDVSPAFISQLSNEIRDLLDRCRNENTELELNLSTDEECGRWLAARYASMPDAVGDRIYILRDISEQKRFEQSETRRRRDQALAEISTVLAHEIRNPLGSLELFAGLLAESGLDHEPQKWVNHLQAGLRTLAATVNNVLDFHSVPEPQRTSVDLGLLFEWAREFFVPLARQSGITFSVQNQVRGIVLRADRHRLEQVLLNLVVNAVRAMPGGGWIELTGYEIHNGSEVVLAVADTGPGISSEDLLRIFDPGFSRRPGSSGLGLAVCRKIVEQHAGTIQAENRTQGGALFTVVFPLISQLKKTPESKRTALSEIVASPAIVALSEK